MLSLHPEALLSHLQDGPLRAVFLIGGGWVCSLGTLGRVWRYICLLQLERAANGIWSAEARCAAKLPAMLRTAPHSPGRSGPECQ